MALPRVLDRELVQAELLGHQREFLIAGIEQRHPDKAIGSDHVVRDIASTLISASFVPFWYATQLMSMAEVSL